ncbi:MAG: hypothetical protein ACD_7C00403G0004 [uncultured bacterium]|nr:MAG: hypothetical protein ACD_7C00403G0004 [uncultured bacterium]KKP69024.1 MAG: hypothetical protein UR66_C0002G0081 [Candidatus Moranbacteria bacterium GW2011_GWE1_35_17]KKP74398.1 MAG: hypothetical protein UR65_C0001G0015 [Candidatus Moranbacteria bacterium GW2011_GWE2_35_164]KKP84118.1 MAG: hypothetical protein UR82_C0012G0014 [Candidatus Moranbacteria bacterium GW2011_GWF1_35_5]KKP85307.1 MAG: hypothetical protein UR83_C0001G0014 [Candidatus Moranbacteria bacterium GW2011_GWF2_35_54]
MSLSEEGRTRGEELMSALSYLFRRKRENYNQIVHAPAVRCKETAYMVSAALPFASVNLEECLNWSPAIADSNNNAVKEMIARYEKSGVTLLIIVSHDAMVNRISEWMISERGGLIAERINLAPGQFCLVHSDGRYTLIPV